MREILFRGKRWDNGEWAFGSLVKALGGEKFWIDSSVRYGIPIIETIDPATVGQYTGLTDKNGVKIFEGDIVKFKHGGEFDKKGVYFRKYEVEFVNTFVTYGLRLRNGSIHFPLKQVTATMHDVVVVGNVHDNPELLKEEL